MPKNISDDEKNKKTDDKTKQQDRLKKDALAYHTMGRPGKIEVNSIKPTMTSRDLSLAYSPGVAYPCLEIAKNPDDVYKYTAKGNLVAVISNGSAVLGLGDIGALAGKPVMEGKGVLFKRFADIDVFDIEINAPTVEEMVNVIKSMEPTFGGINLEDIKAPECFEVETQLIEKMNIPVFHDDQHGTAIIASAGLLNAIEITKRKIEKMKMVFSGAGAAAMACAKLFIHLGAKRENIIMCDSKGVIYIGRKDGMNKYKDEFAVKTDARTLGDAMKNADAFFGLSGRGLVTKDMVKNMAANPIIFAMANPEPEIYPHEVAEVRSDAIMATGRSDFPNQVNNVLGFPFIFRGALDVRATKINIEMKLAAVRALAALAKEEVPEEVKMAYDNSDFTFGPKYIIPKPFDKRVLTRLAPAVAKAAMDSGVARIEIKDLKEYASHLEARLGTSAAFMKGIRDRLRKSAIESGRKMKLVFAEGADPKVIQSVKILVDHDLLEPILLGPVPQVTKTIAELGLQDELRNIEIINPATAQDADTYAEQYFSGRRRDGVSPLHAQQLIIQPNYYGAMMVKNGKADCFVAGPTLSYSECFVPVVDVIKTQQGHRAAGIYFMIFKNRLLMLADCTVQIDPNPEQLSEIAYSSATLFEELIGSKPRVAFLSFSNFGSNSHPSAKKVRKAVELTKQKYPTLQCDGEIQADVATNFQILKNLFPFSDLDRQPDILIFPDLSSANISYKLLTQLSDCVALGPILVPMNHSANIIPRTATVAEIVNISILTALLGYREEASKKKKAKKNE